MVARPGRDADIRNVMLRSHRRDQCLRERRAPAAPMRACTPDTASAAIRPGSSPRCSTIGSIPATLVEETELLGFSLPDRGLMISTRSASARVAGRRQCAALIGCRVRCVPMWRRAELPWREGLIIENERRVDDGVGVDLQVQSHFVEDAQTHLGAVVGLCRGRP